MRSPTGHALRQASDANPIAAAPPLPAKPRCRSGTSPIRKQRYLALSDGFSGEPEGFFDVGGLEIRVRLEDLGLAHPVRDHVSTTVATGMRRFLMMGTPLMRLRSMVMRVKSMADTVSVAPIIRAAAAPSGSAATASRHSRPSQ